MTLRRGRAGAGDLALPAPDAPGACELTSEEGRTEGSEARPFRRSGSSPDDGLSCGTLRMARRTGINWGGNAVRPSRIWRISSVITSWNVGSPARGARTRPCALASVNVAVSVPSRLGEGHEPAGLMRLVGAQVDTEPVDQRINQFAAHLGMGGVLVHEFFHASQACPARGST